MLVLAAGDGVDREARGREERRGGERPVSLICFLLLLLAYVFRRLCVCAARELWSVGGRSEGVDVVILRCRNLSPPEPLYYFLGLSLFRLGCSL